MADESLKALIESMRSSKKYKVMPLVKSNPNIAAFISKLTRPKDKTGFDLSAKHNEQNLNQNQLLNITENTKSRIKDNDDLLTLFPDIELAIQTLVSSVLSPKDMVKTEIIYRTKTNNLPSELTLALNDIINLKMKNEYKLEDECYQILRETLFTAGCYIKAIIPESSLDEIINGDTSVSAEAVSDLFVKEGNVTKSVNLGILGNSGKDSQMPALERFSLDLNIVNIDPCLKISDVKRLNTLEISDNFNFLKLPKLTEKVNKEKISYIIKNINKRVSMEDGQISTNKFANMLYKEGRGESKTFVSIPTNSKAKRKSIGKPMVFKIPAEATIPVYTPGNETKHVGYFILLDIDGNPITRNTNQDFMQGLTGIMNNQNQANDLSTMLIQKAKSNLVGNSSSSMPTIDQLSKIYGNIVETDLIERLKNGLYKQDLSISSNDEIYRIMLSRAFANKYTRIVFIPAELVTYFAFNYHENGTGKSYLDDLKILTSLRAILLFSKVMAMVKSAVNLTHVNITLDPNDPDPQSTVELASHEIIKMRQQYFPLGINSPVDLIDWIQRVGFEFSFEGHPGLPQTKLDFEIKNMQHTLPDSDLDELLRKQTYMAFGLSPETIDNGFNSEFATTVVSNNILLSKRVMQLQAVFTKHLTSYCQKILTNDMSIRDEMVNILKENRGTIEKTLTDEEKVRLTESENSFYDYILDTYIESVELDLPKPDETTLETQTASFDSYVEALDKTINHWVSSEIVTSDMVGDVSGFIDNIKSVLKSHYVRKWMADNNYMPELGDIITSNEDDKPSIDLYEINKAHLEGLSRSTIKFIDSLKVIRSAADKDIEKLNVDPASVSSGGDTGDGSSDTGSDNPDGFGDGFDELPTDEPPADEPPADEPPADKPAEDEEATDKPTPE